MRPCGHRRRLLRYSAAAASILRSSADIVSGGRLLEPPCVAIKPFFTCFSICHAPTHIQARGSVAGSEHGGQGRKVHPSFALRHGSCIGLFRFSLFCFSLLRLSLLRLRGWGVARV